MIHCTRFGANPSMAASEQRHEIQCFCDLRED